MSVGGPKAHGTLLGTTGLVISGGQIVTTALRNDLISTFGLSFEQPIPRHLAHKRSPGNVFLTDLTVYGEDRFLCGARVPRAHRFFNEAGRSPDSDIVFYTELGRQASIAISHCFYDVPYDYVFIFEQSQASLLEAFWTTPDPSSSQCMAIEIKVTEKQRRKDGSVTRIVAEHAIYNEREQVFRGTGAWNVKPPALLDRLRKRSVPVSLFRDGLYQQETPVRPTSVGRELPNNVVISSPKRAPDGPDFVSLLLVDPTHPFFFDHPCDHVPGMLLLEACAQLSTLTAARVADRSPSELILYAYEIQSSRLVECHLPVKITARPSRMEQDRQGVLWGNVHICVSQQDLLSGKATLCIAFPWEGKH
jgi:hypothetical protein